ncbi:MAG: hypothetical protein AB9917_03190 [Negativicutes bacterium]
MHQTLLGKTLQEYYQTGILPSEVRPIGCDGENCLESNRFHRHSRYPRKCVYRQGCGWLPVMWVQRFRCATCGKVFSLFIPIVYKWQRVEHDLQQSVALEEPFHREEVAEAFSGRTLSRWKQKWLAWSLFYLQAITQWLFTLYAFLSVAVTAKQARSPLHYLVALLAQLPGKAPGVVEVLSVCRFGGGSVRKIPQILSLVFP